LKNYSTNRVTIFQQSFKNHSTIVQQTCNTRSTIV